MKPNYTSLLNSLQKVVEESIEEYQKLKAELNESQPVTEDENVG
jgi:hypothetical protein